MWIYYKCKQMKMWQMIEIIREAKGKGGNVNKYGN